MTERKSYVARIIEILERDGQISRKQCLSMSAASARLGARIVEPQEQVSGFKKAGACSGLLYFQ
jgi:hypothetical protein